MNFNERGGKIFYVCFLLGAALFVYVLLHHQSDHFNNVIKLQQQQIRLEKEQIAQDHRRFVKSQISGCQRGNSFRRKVNAGDVVIQGFMQIAINSTLAHEKIDTGARKVLDARNYQLYKKQKSVFNQVPIVNCTKAIKSTTDAPINPKHNP